MSLHLPTPELVQISRLLLYVPWYVIICANNNNHPASGFSEVGCTQCRRYIALTKTIFFSTGGFEDGSPARYGRHYFPVIGMRNNEIRSYDGSLIVNRSIELQQPVIYVCINYR